MAVSGLLLATMFIGVRTTATVAGTLVELTVWRQVAGILAGLLLFGVGLGVARVAIPDSEKQS